MAELRIITAAGRGRCGFATTLLLTVALSLPACTTSRKVEVEQANDAALSCEQLEDEFRRLDQAQADIVKNKGSGSVAGFLFWLPGVAFSEADAEQALALVRERRQRLRDFYKDKDC